MRPKRSAKPKLGRLKKIHPADYWQNAVDFQQWLTEPENLELLGEALGLELDVYEPDDAAETVDDCLLGFDRNSESLVLITVQLDTADDAYLGRLITQAATAEAPVVVWVAAEFSEQHTDALDWLNHIAGSNILFLGVETELWSIGKDAMAVNFKCIAEPESASSNADDDEQGVVAEEDPEPEPEPEPLTETQLENLEFWALLSRHMERQGGLVKPGTPSPDAKMGFAIARAGFRLYAIIDRDANCLHTQLLLSGVDAHPHFYLLAHEQELIVDEIGIPLIWDDSHPEACAITSTLRDADITIRDHWPDYVDWFNDCLERFYEVFFDRIKQLDANLYEPLPNYPTDPLSQSLILPASRHR
jgi:hypothetical protein